MRWRFWRAETGIFLGLWLVLMVGGRSRLFQDPGTFWHTVVGQKILASKQLIYADAFSFTRAGAPWIPHQWLGECTMAALHALGGLDTLLLATVTLLAGLYTWVAHRLIRAGLHWSLAVVVVVLTLAASTSHFHIRPHLGTIVFFGVAYAFLCDFEAGRIGLKQLLWLIPVYLVWTNVHGGMLGGWCTMLLALAGWTGYRLVGWPSPIGHYRQLLPLGLIILACGLSAFVNPYGLLMIQTWFGIMHSDILPQIIMEHAPLNPARPEGQMVLLFAAVYVIALLGVLPARPRVTWFLPLVWFYLTCWRIRHSPLFALSGVLALADFLQYTPWARRLARPGSDLFQFPDATRPERRFPWQAAMLPVAVVLTSVGLQFAAIPVPVLGDGWARLDPDFWPVELLPELRALEMDHPPGTHIFNDYRFGGFLIYYTPNLRVYVDDRCEVYGDQWLKEFDDASKREPQKVEAWSRDPVYGFEFALVHSGTSFDDYLRKAPGWAVIRRTETATLYRRKP